MTGGITHTIPCRDTHGDIVNVLAVSDGQRGEIRYLYEDRRGGSWLLARQADGSFIDALNDRQFWPIVLDFSQPHLVVIGFQDMNVLMHQMPTDVTGATVARRRRHR